MEMNFSWCLIIIHVILSSVSSVSSVWSTWHNDSKCSVSCGVGVRTRIRYCHIVDHLSENQHNHNCPGTRIRTEICKGPPCSVNGGWSSWHGHSQCNVKCGGGVKILTRSCNNPTPANGGQDCQGSSTKSEICSRNPCPVNGGWSKWQSQSECSVTCGGGFKTSIRTCNNPTPAYGGHHCRGTSTRTEVCHSRPCPVNGGWSEWQYNSNCSVSCGGGVRTRVRSCNNPPPAHRGQHCSGDSQKSESCNTSPCPVNGGWSQWRARHRHHRCSVTCGGGVKHLIRSCSNPHPANGGQNCQGPSNMTVACHTEPCPVDGGWSRWNIQSQCSVSCGGGVRTNVRSCNNPSPAHGGQQCSGASTQSESCNTSPCPVNGGWSGWNIQSQCSALCGGGVRTNVRLCNNPSPAHGGQQCSGASTQSESCNTSPCPVNGGWSGWNIQSQCSVSCGGGVRTNVRSCNNPSPAHGGQQCLGASTQSESCNTSPCPVTTTTTTTQQTTTPTTTTTTTTTTQPPTTTTKLTPTTMNIKFFTIRAVLN